MKKTWTLLTVLIVILAITGCSAKKTEAEMNTEYTTTIAVEETTHAEYSEETSSEVNNTENYMEAEETEALPAENSQNHNNEVNEEVSTGTEHTEEASGNTGDNTEWWKELEELSTENLGEIA